MDLGSIAVAVLCMVSMVLLAFGVARFVGGNGDDITQRLDRFATRAAAASDMPEPKDPNARGKITVQLDKELVKRGRGTDITQELARADLKLTPAEFLMIKLV